jgi:hypothetical protein
LDEVLEMIHTLGIRLQYDGSVLHLKFTAILFHAVDWSGNGEFGDLNEMGWRRYGYIVSKESLNQSHSQLFDNLNRSGLVCNLKR